MIRQLRKFVHDKCEWALLPWRLYHRLNVSLRRLQERKRIKLAYLAIDKTIDSLQKRGGPFRVGFYVYNDAVFQLECVFRRMLEDVDFDPYIVIVSGKKLDSKQLDIDQVKLHERAFKRLSQKYPKRVLDSLCDGGTKDFSFKFDICACMHPYDGYLAECCQMSYLARVGKPVLYAHYGFECGDIADKGVIGMTNMGYIWRFYTGSKGMSDLFYRFHPLSKKRGCVVLSGNPKYEALAGLEVRRRNRKRVIIAPHHTIDPKSSFYISNFVRFADFLLSLPGLYPQIDWIFRPHPLLMGKMVDLGYWTEEQRVAYEKKWEQYGNAIYVRGGDYQDDFVNSDALIQDCSSFLAEYHVTGHPQCYMLESEAHAKTQYHGLGMDLLNMTYKAYDVDAIRNFIDEVVVKGHDDKKDVRGAFLGNTLLLNYPNVSRVIVDDIRKSLMSEKAEARRSD